jgi:hypothetical protein
MAWLPVLMVPLTVEPEMIAIPEPLSGTYTSPVEVSTTGIPGSLLTESVVTRDVPEITYTTLWVSSGA